MEKYQNAMGKTLSFFRSEAIHCTKNRQKNAAWPRKPTASQKFSAVIIELCLELCLVNTPFAESARTARPRVLESRLFTLPETYDVARGFLLMQAIDRALVDEVWREMTGYAPARIAGEAQVFLEQQPHAAAFSESVTSALDPAVQRAALGLAFLLFKILEASLGRPFPLLTEERVMAAYERPRRGWPSTREAPGPPSSSWRSSTASIRAWRPISSRSSIKARRRPPTDETVRASLSAC